jgi:HK97 family phage major capsid protein
VISRKMQIQSMDGFEDFLVRKISERIGVKMNVQLFSDIVDDRTVALIETAGALSEADFRSALGSIKGGYDCRVYANQSTIWNDIAGVQDENLRPYFISDTQADDPTMQGRIFGKPVYLDDTLADDTIHVLYVDTIEANLFQDVEILSDVDAKTHATTYGGLAIFEAALGDTRGLATISITVS